MDDHTINNDRDERNYLAGQRSVWVRVMHECIKHLSPEQIQDGWLLEREELCLVLRQLCEERKHR